MRQCLWDYVSSVHTCHHRGWPNGHNDPREPARLDRILDPDLVPNPQEHHGALDKIVQRCGQNRTPIKSGAKNGQGFLQHRIETYKCCFNGILTSFLPENRGSEGPRWVPIGAEFRLKSTENLDWIQSNQPRIGRQSLIGGQNET